MYAAYVVQPPLHDRCSAIHDLACITGINKILLSHPPLDRSGRSISFQRAANNVTLRCCGITGGNGEIQAGHTFLEREPRLLLFPLACFDLHSSVREGKAGSSRSEVANARLPESRLVEIRRPASSASRPTDARWRRGYEVAANGRVFRYLSCRLRVS